MLDSLFETGAKVFGNSDVIERQLGNLLQTPLPQDDQPSAGIISLSLMTLMVLISSV